MNGVAQLSLSKPTDYGAPARFPRWRDGQEDIFLDMLTSSARFDINAASTGLGKSLSYVCAAKALGGRTAILTNSKALQDQLENDFGATGVFDMRGLGNYTCKALDEGGELEELWVRSRGRLKRTPTCDIGPCRSGIPCGLKDDGCAYFDGYRAANKSEIVSTNYAYWIAIHKYGQGLGKFDRLILDECQHAQDALVSALSAEFTKYEFKELGWHPSVGDTMTVWRMWAREMRDKISGKLEFFNQSAKIAANDDGVLSFAWDTDVPDAAEMYMWKSLEARCGTIAEADNDWVIERSGEHSTSIRLAPPWVGKYSENHLFLGIPKVILMSATVRPKTADLLGIQPSQREFTEYPSSFSKANRPVFWLPTVRLNSRSSDADMSRWVQRIDQILDRHVKLGHKGIIHTVSYERQQMLVHRSRYGHLMLANTTKTTSETVQAFRKSTDGILVSPSVSTGYDFPDDACRFQIVGKIPFRDARGAVEKAQVARDSEYLDYLTVQEIVQLYGRAVRSETDAAVCWIVDDHIEWFVQKYRKFFTDYFLEGLLDDNGNIRTVKYVQNALFPELLT